MLALSGSCLFEGELGRGGEVRGWKRQTDPWQNLKSSLEGGRGAGFRKVADTFATVLPCLGRDRSDGGKMEG